MEDFYPCVIDGKDDGTVVEEVVQADQACKQFTHKECIRVHVLRELGWTMREISVQIGIPLGSVHNIPSTRTTPKSYHRRIARSETFLNTLNKERRLTWVQLPK